MEKVKIWVYIVAILAIISAATGTALASTTTSESGIFDVTGGPQNAEVGILANSPFQIGDVFAGIGNGVIRHYDKNGNFIENLVIPNVNTEDTGMAFDSVGNLYATVFQAQNVAKFNNTGGFLNFFGSGYNSDPESIAIDTAGNIYVGQADGLRRILKFDSAGNPLAYFSPATGPRGTDWIDLAADQCTIFYTSEGTTIRRFNVCTNTQLSDFATGLHGAAYALRILPSGGVLVADTQDVHRLDASGNIVQTYPAPAGDTTLFALNLDPDGTSFWTGDLPNGKIHKFDIATGNLLMTINTTDQGTIISMAGITVFGEIKAAQAVTKVPAFTPIGIAALAVLLGLLAIVTIRRRL